MPENGAVNRSLARAWILLCLGLGLHIFDEATTGFLGIYNPTVIALRERLGWWPMPTFEFSQWLVGLLLALAVLLALTGFVAGGVRGTRPLAYGFAIIMLLNAGGHTLATIFGRTVGNRDLFETCARILVVAVHGRGRGVSAGATSTFFPGQG